LNSPTTSANPGRLVVAVGIPGSGKSSVFNCLGEVSGLRVIREPDEPDWHRSVTAHGYADPFSALTWFRSVRVPQLRLAAELRRRGETVLVDDYYDKLLCDILGAPGLEGLIPPTDAYYGVFGELARIDRTMLPDADCLVFFEVEKEDWRTMLRTRHNEYDRAPGFEDIHALQPRLLDVADRYCREQKVPLVRFLNKRSSVEEAANVLYGMLKEKSVLS
jgi:hypothetical protein